MLACWFACLHPLLDPMGTQHHNCAVTAPHRLLRSHAPACSAPFLPPLHTQTHVPHACAFVHACTHASAFSMRPRLCMQLLGETRLLAEQSRQAVYAFEKAAALRGDDLQIATGMVDAYIANGQHAKAVAYLQHLRTLAPPVSSLGVVAVDAHTSTTDTAAHPATGSTAAQGDSSSGTGALAQEDAAGMGGAAATEGSPGSPAGTTSTGAGAGTSTTSSHQDAEPAGAFMDEGSSAYTYAHPVYEAPALQAGSWAEEAGAADQAPAAAAAALAVGDTVEGAATSVDASDAGGASLASASVGGQPASTSMSQGAPEGGGSGAEGSHEAVGAQEEVGAQGGVRRSSPLKPLDPVSIELLLAKVYAVWRGHAADAVAT